MEKLCSLGLPFLIKTNSRNVRNGQRILHFHGPDPRSRHVLEPFHAGEALGSRSGLPRHRLGLLRRQRLPHPHVHPHHFRGLPDCSSRIGSHPVLSTIRRPTFGLQVSSKLFVSIVHCSIYDSAVSLLSTSSSYDGLTVQ